MSARPGLLPDRSRRRRRPLDEPVRYLRPGRGFESDRGRVDAGREARGACFESAEGHVTKVLAHETKAPALVRGSGSKAQREGPHSRASSESIPTWGPGIGSLSARSHK